MRVALFALFVFFAAGQVQWTWDGGSNTINQLSVGTNPGATPSGRGGPVVWALSDRVYVVGGNGTGIGGSGLGPLQDVWVLDLASKNWTREKGSDTLSTASNYGSLNVEAVSNQPGARQGAAGWTDSQGGYMFGGLGYSGGALGYLNDLWYFRFSTRQWTWIGGSQTRNNPGNYPGIGLNDPSTLPRARYFANVVQFGTRVFVFGGAYSISAVDLRAWSYLNDFFVFDTATREWLQLGGSSTGARVGGTYGSYRVPSAASYPGGRESSIVWRVSTTKFFMGLGYGYVSGASSEGYLQDVWSYETSSSLWSWEGGSRAVNGRAVYTAAPLVLSRGSIVGSREDAQAFALPDGAVIFGGTGFIATSVNGWLSDSWLWDYPNDLWVWYGGAAQVNQLGNYVAVGQSGYPGGSAELAPFCTASGDCFVAMGRGYGGVVGAGNGYLNAVWKLTMPTSVRSAVNFAPIPAVPLSIGVLVAIAVGGAAGLVLAIIAICCIAKHCRARRSAFAGIARSGKMPSATQPAIAMQSVTPTQPVGAQQYYTNPPQPYTSQPAYSAQVYSGHQGY